MFKTELRFPASGGYRQAYTNNDIEGFKGEELFDNLVREIIQNALDAKRDDCTDAVRVKFRVENLAKDKYDVFKTYNSCIKGCRRFWGESADKKLLRFLDGADSIIEKDLIPTFVASDYNTKGLVGSQNGRLDSPWEALTNEDGVSAAKSESSGGSYGIGKNAPFACSSLSMVFYNTYAIDEKKAFTGVAKLATLYDENDDEKQRIGKYQKYNDETNKMEPIYAEDQCELRDLFERDEYGTDVIVSGFNQTNWVDNVKKAVIRHFFVAIKEEKLVVEILDNGLTYLINSIHLPEIVSGYKGDSSMNITIQLYTALTQPDKIEQLSILEENDLELYIKSCPDYSRTIANFRDTGMLVGQKSRRIFQHYAAVIIVRKEKLSGLLKDTEPPRHNRWDYKLITGDELKERRKLAKQCIEKIDELVLEVLKKQFEVITEDSVDAEGFGDYLPDDVDELGGAGAGDDALRAKIKIGKVQTLRRNETTKNTPGEKDEGKEVEGEVHNNDINPDPYHDRFPKPVIPDDDGETPGVIQGEGPKSIIIPIMRAQRAFPVSVDQGLYKIILVPDDNYKNMYINCFALGEDGSKDKVKILSMKHNGTPINLKDNCAGPISIDKDINSIFYAKFDTNEKLTLSISMQEVTK